jgi:hypothetical protein
MMDERPCGCPCCAPPATHEGLVALLGPDYDRDDPTLEDITF